MTLPCIRCGKQLESAIPRSVQYDMPDWQPENQPHAGTTFIARGQYGSTVFDPEGHAVAGQEFLEVNVCDECMLAAAREGRILYGHKRPQPIPIMTPWDVSNLIWCERCGRAVQVPHGRHDDETPWD